MDLKSNTLYQYKGGGYDGCFWEWNYAAIDSRNNFIDIYSSGHRSCESKEELAEYYPLAPGNGVYTYDLGNPDSLLEFATFSNAGHVIATAKILFAKLQVVIPATCYNCGSAGSAHEMHAGGLTGAGGVAMKYTSIICHNCAER